VRIDDGRENYERRGWNLIYISRARSNYAHLPEREIPLLSPSPFLYFRVSPNLVDQISLQVGRAKKKEKRGVRLSWKAAMMSETTPRLDAWISFARALPARGNARQHFLSRTSGQRRQSKSPL